MNREADILIVGAGLAGACMANLLVRGGRIEPARIAVVEPKLAAPRAAGPEDWDLRVSAVSRATERILRTCNVWDAMPASRVNAYERMCVWDESGNARGNGAVRFDCADIGQPNLGYIVENLAMQAALLDAARVAGVQLLDAQVTTLEPYGDGMKVGLQDGRSFHAGLVIAADGADSRTREMMGISTRAGTYHQRAIVTHIRTRLPHERTAWQRFLSTGPIALLPVRDEAGENRCSIVWSTSEDTATALMALDDAAFCKAVEQATDGVLGPVESCVRRAAFPLRHSHAERYVLPRFALIGDAAHTIHPLAGQGVNLGFLDAAVLAQVLDESLESGGDIGDLQPLRRYERWRKGENLLMLASLDGLNRLFSNSSQPLGRLRRVGLSVVDRVKPVKGQFMRRALGLTGELPVAAKR